MFPKTLVVAALAAAALAAAGCGGDGDDGPDSPTPAASAGAIAAELPDDIKSKGTLTVAADATYPPNEFLARGRQDDRRHVARPRRCLGEGSRR